MVDDKLAHKLDNLLRALVHPYEAAAEFAPRRIVGVLAEGAGEGWPVQQQTALGDEQADAQPMNDLPSARTREVIGAGSPDVGGCCCPEEALGWARSASTLPGSALRLESAGSSPITHIPGTPCRAV
jgi:hypothetical protein